MRTRLLRLILRWIVRPIADRWPVEGGWLRVLRVVMNARGMVLRPPRGSLLQTLFLEDCSAEWIDTSSVVAHRERAFLYFHGGGFVAGSPRSHRKFTGYLSQIAEGPVLSVDYRYPPESSIAGGMDDALAAYRLLLDEGWAPHQVIIAGDGAGGNLAFQAAVQAAGSGLPAPAGVVALSPWLDLSLKGDTIEDKDVTSLPFLRRCAAAAGEAPGQPRAGGLPPVLIQVGSTERLRCDSEDMAERLIASGVPCTLQFWERQVHAFPTYAPLIPEAGQAIMQIAEFARHVTQVPEKVSQ